MNDGYLEFGYENICAYIYKTPLGNHTRMYDRSFCLITTAAGGKQVTSCFELARSEHSYLFEE